MHLESEITYKQNWKNNGSYMGVFLPKHFIQNLRFWNFIINFATDESDVKNIENE